MSRGTSSDEGSATFGDGQTLSTTFRAVAVAALLGAAAIHFAYAPAHFDDATSHGVFFVVVAWAQVAALAALLRWPERREPWLGAAGLSLAVVGVWVVSRTTGVPGDSSEALGWADGMATGLEVVTLLVALAVLQPALASRPAPRFSPALSAVVVVVLLGSVSVVLDPSVGHDDDGHSHGDEPADDDSHEHGDDEHAGHGGDAELVDVDREDRCDIGFNTPTFNETAAPTEPMSHDDDGSHEAEFTLDEWADVFVQPGNPMADSDVTPEQAVAFMEGDSKLAEGVTSGGVGHTLEPDPWLPMTDHEECEKLAEELERAQAVVEKYPTAQDAMDAGYRMVTPFLPAIAAHYINFDYTDEFDIDNPGMMLYDGNGPDAQVVGVSHYVFSPDGEPEGGFSSPNFHWHRHFGLCISAETTTVIGGTNLTDEECAELGGFKNEGSDQYMSHTWVVPGCESDWGMFSGANPAIPARTPNSDNPFDTENFQNPVPSGCGSGKSLDDELEFDEGGHGPSLN